MSTITQFSHLHMLAIKVKSYSNPNYLTKQLDRKGTIISARIAEIFKYLSPQKTEPMSAHQCTVEKNRIFISYELLNSFFSSLSEAKIFQVEQLKKHPGGYLLNCLTNAIQARESEIACNILASGFIPTVADLEMAGRYKLKLVFEKIMERLIETNPDDKSLRNTVLSQSIFWSCYNGWKTSLDIMQTVNLENLCKRFNVPLEYSNPLSLSLYMGHVDFFTDLLQLQIGVHLPQEIPPLYELAASKDEGALNLLTKYYPAHTYLVLSLACKYGYEALAIRYFLDKKEIREKDIQLFIDATQNEMVDFIKLFFDRFSENKIHKVETKLYQALSHACEIRHKQMAKLLLKKLRAFYYRYKLEYSHNFYLKYGELFFDIIHKAYAIGYAEDAKFLLHYHQKKMIEAHIKTNYMLKLMMPFNFGGSSNTEEYIREVFDILNDRFSEEEEEVDIFLKEVICNGFDQLIEHIASKTKKKNILAKYPKYHSELLEIPESVWGEDYRENYNLCFLSIACVKGKKSTAKLLIECEAKVANITTYKNVTVTPLILSVKNGWIDVVEMILERLPEETSERCSEQYIQTDSSGKTALDWACHLHHWKIALLLLKKGCIPKENEQKKHAFCNVFTSGLIEGISFFLESYSEDQIRTSCTEVMKDFFSFNDDFKKEFKPKSNDAAFSMLIKAGADLNACREQLIPYLAACGYQNALRLALEQLSPELSKKSIESSVIQKKSPLWLACNEGHEETAQMLVDAGANCIPFIGEERSVYAMACEKNMDGLVATILSQLSRLYSEGATVDERGKYIYYPECFFKTTAFGNSNNVHCLKICGEYSEQLIFANLPLLASRAHIFHSSSEESSSKLQDTPLLLNDLVIEPIDFKIIPGDFEIIFKLIHTGKIRDDEITYLNCKRLWKLSGFLRLEKYFRKKLREAIKIWIRCRPECANWLKAKPALLAAHES